MFGFGLKFLIAGILSLGSETSKLDDVYYNSLIEIKFTLCPSLSLASLSFDSSSFIII